MPKLSLSQQFSGRAEHLRRTPWLIVLRNAWLALLAGVFLKLLLPAQLAASLRPLLLVAPLLLLIAKDLAHLPGAIARTRAILPPAWRRPARQPDRFAT